MALNFRKIAQGLRIVPKTASTVSERGDLDIATTGGSAGKLNYHNGTTASPVVTETHAATLTLKTLTSPVLNTATADTITGITDLNLVSPSNQIVNLQSSGNGYIKTSSSLVVNSTLSSSSASDSSSGAAVTLSAPSKQYVRLTNGGLTGIAGITIPSNPSILDGFQLIINNTTGNSVTIFNESGSASASNRIFTGTNGPIVLLSNASLQLVYNSSQSRWMVIGGTGGGASTFYTTGSNAAVVAYNAVYLNSSGIAQKLDAGSDSTIEFIGVALEAGGGSIRVQVGGEVEIPVSLIEGGAFTPGKPIYASTSNPGKYQSAIPTNAGVWIVPVGIATTSTKMTINAAGSATAVKITSDSDAFIYANLVSVSSNTTLTNGNSIVLVNATSGSRTITLPAPTSGKIFNIKKIDSSANTVTISPPSGTIDGSASRVIFSQYDSLTITSDGTNYFLI